MNMEEKEDMVIMYNVKAETDKGVVDRKAIDVISLKQFLEERKSRFSIFGIDMEKIGKDDNVHMYIARAAMSILGEIEQSVDQSLGIKEQTEEHEEPVPQPAPQPTPPPMPAPSPAPITPEVLPPTEPIMKGVPVSEKDNRIVL